MPSSSITLTLKYIIIPSVRPGGDANAFSSKIVGQTKATLTKVTTELTEKGISLTTTGGGSENWTGLSIGASMPELLSTENMNKLNGMISKLKTATDLLVKVAKLVELVISSFGSLSTIIKTLLGVIQTQVNNWIRDLNGIGLYFNMIVPPAFQEALYGNLKLNNLSSGGFHNFVSTLGVSFNNTADKNRPVFSEDAQVGGFIVLIDADTLDQFMTTMETFSRMFSFMDLLPVNTKPQPPVSLTGVMKYDKKVGKYGIKLKWKGSPVYSPEFRISRSMKPGGRKGEKDIDLTRLKLYASKEMNLFTAVKIKIQTKEWPKEKTRIYDDMEAKALGVPEFGAPVIVPANTLTGGGTYTDYNIKIDKDGKPAPLTYYYAVEAGTGMSKTGVWSNKIEVAVSASPKCINENNATVVKHTDERGRDSYGFIRSGWQGFGRWSSIKLVIPFVGDFASLFKNILDSIAGMVNNASSSFSSFIKSIKDKIDYYINMVEALTGILQAIQSLKLSGRVAYLYLPVKSGGIAGFMSRVKSAAPISGGFSGSSGITAGMVFVTGIPAFDVSIEDGTGLLGGVNLQAEAGGVQASLGGDSAAAYKQAIALKNKTFESLVKIFMSIFGG